MSKTVTLRLDDATYDTFKKFAQIDNRAISNFIETATTRYIEEIEYADEFEMQEINSNKELLNSLDAARKDIRSNRRTQIV